MGEIKSVKVDNWGVFFLQKLQNFFNKTDYCDLTLQFRDNSQLKVHRLVLSACTDYFNVLEQTCEMIDDALIMPNELQADVVVPIVNFMYTGTLEFELKMYGKLLRTAKEMNMTVLLKLLEAHRRTMEGVNRLQRPPSPKSVRRGVATTPNISPQQPNIQQRRVLTSPNNGSGVQRRIVKTKTFSANPLSSNSTTLTSRQQIGATSLIKTGSGANSSTSAMQVRAQYGNITVFEAPQTTIKEEPEESTVSSPFEQLRKGYNNNKRPASDTFISPPTKKLNIEDVKEFAEQQRMRKQIAAEYGEDQGEYESSMMDDDIHNDDDDDELATPSATTSASAAAVQASTSRQTLLQHGATTITINQNEKPPTIVVKDSSNSKMNHAKIIKEVLRQYPHLVKSNKNIKLKIMPSCGDQPQKIIVKKEQLDNISGDSIGNEQTQSPVKTQTVVGRTQTSQTLLKPMEKPQTRIQQSQSQQTIATKVLPAQQKTATTVTTPTAAATGGPAVPTQKRRIDSKTMHALIALGAENTSGPWLCLRCGVNGRPISIPSYRGFRRHLINTHKELIDPALCEHCGWRSNTNRELHFHMEVEHKVKTTSYTFPQCLLCSNSYLDTMSLNQHMVDAHPDENKQQCIYCNKIFARELQLYNHMKTYHKKQALEDGIIDYSDEEFSESQDATDPVQETTTKEKKESKIKIISDISLPSAGTILTLDNSTDAVSFSNTVATNANTNLGLISRQQEYTETTEGAIITAEPKFVNVDGNEMVLTDEQRQEIMAQLNQEHGAGGVVMVLNEPAEYATEADTNIIANQDEVGRDGEPPIAEHESDPDVDAEPEPESEVVDEEIGDTAADSSAGEDDFDDSQIYHELHTAQGTNCDVDTTADKISRTAVIDEKKNTSGGSALDESKESTENLEWAENLISAHEMADEALEADKPEEVKKDDVINQKLKELTGDWSEDENDEEQVVETTIPTGKMVVGEESLPCSEHSEKNEDKIGKDQSTTTKEQKVDKVVCEKLAIKEEEENENLNDNPGYAQTHADDSKGGEDDIDMLMKNLHKDDTNEPIKSIETAEVNKEADIPENDENIVKEKTCLDEPKESIRTESKLKADDVQGEKREDVDNIVALERDALLAELIGLPKEEFIPESAKESADVKKIGIVAPEDSITSACEPSPTEAMIAMEEEENEAKSVDGDIKVSAAAAGVGAENDGAAENVAQGVKDVAAVIGDTNATKTAERVKSLISEWADDEEDDDPDAATATREEQL